ncbi:MAG: membrane protein insertion efficiency factor YidD [Patescibacteria group bacterium]
MQASLFSFYQKWISPYLVLLLGHACRFTPTCSLYTKQAVKKYGTIKGLFLGIKRVIRCNPFSKAGYDPLI